MNLDVLNKIYIYNEQIYVCC